GLPARPPRLIGRVRNERVIDDGITDALAVWSPDASKIATSFETDIAIYDAGGRTPTQARLPLGDELISASVSYEQKMPSKKVEPAKSNNKTAASPTPTPNEAPQSSTPASFNPIVRVEWPSPD